MTVEEFKALKALVDCRVRMVFTDGQEVIATLTHITTDLDESRHLIYDRVEWSALPHLTGKGSILLAGRRFGELLLGSREALDPTISN